MAEQIPDVSQGVREIVIVAIGLFVGQALEKSHRLLIGGIGFTVPTEIVVRTSKVG
jgi:hypothetical protein